MRLRWEDVFTKSPKATKMLRRAAGMWSFFVNVKMMNVYMIE